MEEKEIKLKDLYKYTSLETIANIYVSFVAALYRISLLLLLVSSLILLFGEGFIALPIAFGGYVIVTLIFGSIAIFIQMHENLKNLAEKNI